MSAPVLWACPECGADTVPIADRRRDCVAKCEVSQAGLAGWASAMWHDDGTSYPRHNARPAPIVIPPDTQPTSRCPSCGTPAERTRGGEPVCDAPGCAYRGWAHRYARAPVPAVAVADPLAGVRARAEARLAELPRAPCVPWSLLALDLAKTLVLSPTNRQCIHGDPARRNTACRCERAQARDRELEP